MRAELLKRIEQLSLEIRNYPTPIARCDLQLQALIEERANLMKEFDLLNDRGGCGPAALWANDGGVNAA